MANINKIKLPNSENAYDLVDAGAVRFDSATSLTDAQKLQARTNIGVSDLFIYKGGKKGSELAALTASDVKSGWVYTCTEDYLPASGTHFHNGYEYCANVSGSTLTWVELGQWIDISGKQDKDTDAVAGNVAKFVSGGNTVDAGFAADNVLLDTDTFIINCTLPTT